MTFKASLEATSDRWYFQAQGDVQGTEAPRPPVPVRLAQKFFLDHHKGEKVAKEPPESSRSL